MYLHAATNTLVYHTSSPLKIAAVTEGARRINGEHVAVPITLDNLQGLRGIDMPVVPPMQALGYDWPIRRPWKPLAHQMVTANFLVLHKRAFCLNDMGTMKTLSALWAADFLMEMYRRKGEACRALISAPLSIIESVWGDAIFRNFIGRRTFRVLHGSALKRERELSKLADFYIINHDGLGVGFTGGAASQGLARALTLRDDIRLAIVDEASVYRDATTKRHRIARALLQRDYLWLLTGTPTPNGPLDAYGLAKLVNGAHGESFTAYKHRVMQPVQPGNTWTKWVPKVGANKAAKQLLTPAVRFAIEDCVDLPECVTERRDAPMSDEQKKAYKELKREAVLLLKSGEIQAVNQAALRTKLIQIACGAVYDQNHTSHEIDVDPRVAVLKEAMNECNEKIIVFAPLTNVLNMLYQRLEDYDCVVFNGAVPHRERAGIVHRFQNGNSPRTLLADPATMAHGLTLTAATTVIWYAPTDKTELYIQANKRIDRPGQTKVTRIIQIASTPIEREIFDRLENNQSMLGVILKLAEDKHGLHA